MFTPGLFNLMTWQTEQVFIIQNHCVLLQKHDTLYEGLCPHFPPSCSPVRVHAGSNYVFGRIWSHVVWVSVERAKSTQRAEERCWTLIKMALMSLLDSTCFSLSVLWPGSRRPGRERPSHLQIPLPGKLHQHTTFIQKQVGFKFTTQQILQTQMFCVSLPAQMYLIIMRGFLWQDPY